MDPVHYIRNCFRAIRNWFRHHTFLIKSILFIIGLAWSTMMEKTFVKILISGAGDLPSLVVVNLLQGISSVFILVFTYATGGSLVRFFVVDFSTSSILGLITYYKLVAAGNDDKEQLHLWSLYLAMAVMASAKAALTVNLKDVLDDHLRPMYHDYYQRKRLTKLLWSPVYLVAAEFAHLEPLTGLFITVMLCLLSVFLLSSYSNNYYALTTGYVRATEADNQSQSRRVEARPLYLFLLWICLLILSLVSASPSTFFFLEGSPFKGRDYLTAILSLDNLLRFKLRELGGEIQPPKQEMMGLLKIGMALSCSALFCSLAMGTAMSVYWLTPLFFILGLAVELAKDGFESLYESQVPSHLKRYGLALGELARRLGALLNILCIIIFRGRDSSWFQDDIVNNSFNMYCNFRAHLSAYTCILFLLVVVWYKGRWIFRDDEEIYDHLQ